MLKYVIILAIGVAIGYGFGFQDAKTHEETIVTRTIDRVGGSHRNSYNNDVDARMDRATR